MILPSGYCEDELAQHISQLHEYNDIKDVGQMLLGKLGEQQGGLAGTVPLRGYAEPGLLWAPQPQRTPLSCS